MNKPWREIFISRTAFGGPGRRMAKAKTGYLVQAKSFSRKCTAESKVMAKRHHFLILNATKSDVTKMFGPVLLLTAAEGRLDFWIGGGGSRLRYWLSQPWLFFFLVGSSVLKTTIRPLLSVRNSSKTILSLR